MKHEIWSVGCTVCLQIWTWNLGCSRSQTRMKEMVLELSLKCAVIGVMIALLRAKVIFVWNNMNGCINMLGLMMVDSLLLDGDWHGWWVGSMIDCRCDMMRDDFEVWNSCYHNLNLIDAVGFANWRRKFESEGIVTSKTVMLGWVQFVIYLDVVTCEFRLLI